MLYVTVCRKILIEKDEKQPKRILVIGNTNANSSLKTCNDVIATLKRCGDDKVVIETNIRKTNEVGTYGIVQWISEKITTMDVVIFIVLSPGDYAVMVDDHVSEKAHQYKDYSQVAAAIKAAETIMLHRPKDSTKFLAYCSCKHPDSSFCQYYDMRSQEKQFLKHALGSVYKYKAARATKRRSAVKTHGQAFMSAEDSTDLMLECSSIGDQPITPQNDLNQSANFGTKYMTSTMSNIDASTSYNQLESVENNEMV